MKTPNKFAASASFLQRRSISDGWEELRLKNIILTLIGLLCFQPATAAEQQILELEQLLLNRDYKGIVERIDKRNDNEEEIVMWLRSHYEEWHPPLFYALSAKIADKLLVSVTAKFKEGNKSIDAEDSRLLREMVDSYARGRTSFMFDITDCVDNRLATPTFWLRRNNATTLAVESLLALDKTGKGLTTAAGLSFLWANPIVVHHLNDAAARPQTTWLCGGGNVLPDQDRHGALESKLNAVNRKLEGLRRSPLPN